MEESKLSLDHQSRSVHVHHLNLIPFTIALGNYQAEILYWGYTVPQWWRNYWHSHDFFEVYYICQGAGRIYFDAANHRVHQGQIIVARPRQAHEMISSRKNPLAMYFPDFTLIHLSPRQTQRLFQQARRTTIHQYQLEMRLESAAQMLFHRELPVKEVAQACGYPDVQYFTNLFRRRMGRPPAEYREGGGTKFLARRR